MSAEIKDESSATGWTIECDRCHKTQTFSQPSRLRAIGAMQDDDWILTADHTKAIELCRECFSAMGNQVR